MSSSEAQRIPSGIKPYFQELKFRFGYSGYNTPWATAVFTTLREFHDGLYQPENLLSADMDKPFHDFLHKHGDKLFGEKSDLRRQDEAVPVFNLRDLVFNPAEVYRTFNPIRKCFLYLSQGLRRKQKSQKTKRASLVEPANLNVIDISEIEAQIDNIDTPIPGSNQDRDIRFPEFSKDDLVDDEHSVVNRGARNQRNQTPWIIRYLPSDPHPSGLAVDRIYPVVRRVCRKDSVSDWYVHWDQNGHKTWLLLRYNSTYNCYCLYHQNGDVQRIDRDARGGVPRDFIPQLKRQNNDNPGPQLGSAQKSNKLTPENSASLRQDIESSDFSSLLTDHDRGSPLRSIRASKRAVSDNDYNPSDSRASKRVTRGMGHPSSASLIDRLSCNPSTTILGERVIPSHDKDGRPELPGFRRVSGESPSSPHRQDVERQASHVQRIHSKISPQTVKVTPCILGDNLNWREWQYGKLSSLNVDSLFTCVAKSYDIDENANFIEVQLHLMDLMPEETAIIRRGNVDDFKQVIARCGEGAMANKYRTRDSGFWVGLRPVIETLDI